MTCPLPPPKVHLRFEMEMERIKQIHQKELEDKDEELEDVQKSSQRRVGTDGGRDGRNKMQGYEFDIL